MNTDVIIFIQMVTRNNATFKGPLILHCNGQVKEGCSLLLLDLNKPGLPSSDSQRKKRKMYFVYLKNICAVSRITVLLFEPTRAMLIQTFLIL